MALMNVTGVDRNGHEWTPVDIFLSKKCLTEFFTGGKRDPSPVAGANIYDDAGVEYHDPRVENLRNALLGLHSGLKEKALTNHQGVAIYCEWKTSESEWEYFGEHF